MIKTGQAENIKTRQILTGVKKLLKQFKVGGLGVKGVGIVKQAFS